MVDSPHSYQPEHTQLHDHNIKNFKNYVFQLAYKNRTNAEHSYWAFINWCDFI